MEIRLKENDNKLDLAFNLRNGTGKRYKQKIAKDCYSKDEIREAVRLCAKEEFERTGELPKTVYVAIEPSYTPWRVLKFSLLWSGVYSFKHFVNYPETRTVEPYILIRDGDDLYENTYGALLSSLERDLKSSVLTDYLRQEQMSVYTLYDTIKGYRLGNCSIAIVEDGIMVFGLNRTLNEQELLEHLKQSRRDTNY